MPNKERYLVGANHHTTLFWYTSALWSGCYPFDKFPISTTYVAHGMSEDYFSVSSFVFVHFSVSNKQVDSVSLYQSSAF